jgi:ABC-type uncharacterized transport system auxiliary subunit
VKRCLLLFPMIGLLSACFGGGQVVPQDRYYHLADISADVIHVTKPFGVVGVSILQSDALHRDRSILYSEQATPLQLNRYHYHHWTDAPGQLVQEHLIAYLRKAGFAREVIRYGAQSRIDAQISGRILRFERLVDQGKVAVRIELSFATRHTQDQRHLIRVYDLERDCKDSSMNAAVEAFSKALQDIYNRFVTDIMHASDAQTE